jgi:hypothetical protein
MVLLNAIRGVSLKARTLNRSPLANRTKRQESAPEVMQIAT